MSAPKIFPMQILLNMEDMVWSFVSLNILKEKDRGMGWRRRVVGVFELNLTIALCIETKLVKLLTNHEKGSCTHTYN